MLDKTNKYVGTIIQPESNKYFSFMLNNEAKVQIDSIVAIEVSNPDNKNDVLLSKIRKIETSYYIKNPDLYFLNKAANNQLDNINKTNTQYGIIAICDILGFYNYSERNGFVASKEKIGLYTPQPLQKVYLIEEKHLSSIYGLSKKTEDSIYLGDVVHPFNSSVILNSNIFKIHTLISGISGAGKTRLASLIIKNLAKIGAHVVIIDPHFEYLDLLIDKKPSNEKSPKINIYSRLKKSYKTDNLLKQFEKLKEIENVEIKNLEFSSQLLTSSTLCKILPNLSSQQQEIIHSLFEAAFKEYTENESNENLLIYFYNYLNQQVLFNDEEINHLIYEEKGKQVLFAFKVNDYLEQKRQRGHFSVIESVAKRLNDLIQENIFTDEIPSWLGESSYTIDIITDDFSDDEVGKRMVNTIMSHYLEVKSKDKQRVLVIDEAHKLLNIEDSQTRKLIFQLLRESRKFNTALLLLTQNYNDLPPDILSLFHNGFRFKEISNDELKNLPSKMCHVNIVNSICNYIMKVDNVPSFF